MKKDIMILSLVITNSSPAGKIRFINRKDYLINVAVTRAGAPCMLLKSKFCLEYKDEQRLNGPIRALAAYSIALKKKEQ
jgi:hypothetical protein